MTRQDASGQNQGEDEQKPLLDGEHTTIPYNGDGDDNHGDPSTLEEHTLPIHSSHHPPSCWDTACVSPMTSLPHFDHHQHYQHRHPQHSSWMDDLCLPPLNARSNGRLQQNRQRQDPEIVEEEERHRKQRSRSVGNEMERILQDRHVNELNQLPQYQDVVSLLQPQKNTVIDPNFSAQTAADATTSTSNENNDDYVNNGEETELTATSPPPSTMYDSFGPPNPMWISALYGMINASIVLPVLLSFGAIIYQHDAFQPYLGRLMQLTLVSGMVHQLTFSTLSSLPFAVGQVQDAGLLFLSTMASDMANHIQQKQQQEGGGEPDDDAVLLATVTVGLGLATALLGVALVLFGQFGWAKYVQCLPTCVVGGYLAYIGWFCGLSGVGIMMGPATPAGTDSDDDNTTIWWFWKVLPGLVGGTMIYVSVRQFRHMAVLPTCILLLLATFYTVLAWTGTTLEEATRDGWIRNDDNKSSGGDSGPASMAWYQTWEYLKLDLVEWSVFPRLALTELAMILVVALSSSLDVAAIELELKRPLQYNRELATVGWSNIASGLTGGYTGSYIFSQSIFSLRAGITSRAAGYFLAACQCAVWMSPVNILALLPNFFFGSLLVLICLDLLVEWLWDVRHRVTRPEHAICLATFGFCQWGGVEMGILGGVAVYLVCQQLGLLTAADAETPSRHHDGGSRGAALESPADSFQDEELGANNGHMRKRIHGHQDSNDSFDPNRSNVHNAGISLHAVTATSPEPSNSGNLGAAPSSQAQRQQQQPASYGTMKNGV